MSPTLWLQALFEQRECEAFIILFRGVQLLFLDLLFQNDDAGSTEKAEQTDGQCWRSMQCFMCIVFRVDESKCKKIKKFLQFKVVCDFQRTDQKSVLTLLCAKECIFIFLITNCKCRSHSSWLLPLLGILGQCVTDICPLLQSDLKMNAISTNTFLVSATPIQSVPLCLFQHWVNSFGYL